MHKFTRNLITEWRKLELPFTDNTIVVAVSGGADSMSLLVAIHDLVQRKKLDLRVIGAHFNHKLRGRESDADERFVRKEVERRGLEVITGGRRVSAKGNLEQNARDARYHFLFETAAAVKAPAVLTGHTKNDQAETFLLNLIRGSGPDGLAGMRSVRTGDDETLLARPLLSWATRADTEEFCREHGIAYRQDRMNRDQKFIRARIRHTILPALAEINPKIIETLAQTSDLLRNTISTEIENGSGQTDDLALKDLRPLTKGDLYSTLRSWLRAARGDLRGLQLKHIESVERLIFSQKSGKTVELPGRGMVVKQGGRLSFSNIKVDK